MQVIAEKNSGKFSEELKSFLGMLEDGRYILSIRSLNPFKSEREFQNEYFALVDSVRDITGDTRYEIHESFKVERNIETTRDFGLQDWIDFIEAFKWYYFTKADILL